MFLFYQVFQIFLCSPVLTVLPIIWLTCFVGFSLIQNYHHHRYTLAAKTQIVCLDLKALFIYQEFDLPNHFLSSHE